jgi:hypothetical protein
MRRRNRQDPAGLLVPSIWDEGREARVRLVWDRLAHGYVAKEATLMLGARRATRDELLVIRTLGS